MGKIKILHSESKGYCRGAKKILNSFAQVDYADLTTEQVKQRVHRYDALIVRLRNKVDADMVKRAGRLRLVASATTGTDHIDEKALKKQGIPLVCLKGETRILNSVYSTAEHTMGLILSLLRHAPFAFQSVLKGEWDTEHFRGHEVNGKMLGIIGLGRLGKMVARYAHGMGMNVIAYDVQPVAMPKYVKRASLNQLLKASDVVTIHIPFNQSNIQFMNGQRLRKMKKGSYLINTSRGAIVNDKALLDSLVSGRLAGAAVDVLSGEEKSGFKAARHPLVQYAKRQRNCIITPHIGGAAIEAVEKTDIFIAQKIRSCLKRMRT